MCAITSLSTFILVSTFQYLQAYQTTQSFQSNQDFGSNVILGKATSYGLTDISSGNCNLMESEFDKDHVVAMNKDNWRGATSCGKCIQMSCIDCPKNDYTMIVQVVDQCPGCAKNQLDLTSGAFQRVIGMSPGIFPILWTQIDCEIGASIKICKKVGSNPYWLAIQPTEFAASIASVKINGAPAPMMPGAFYYLAQSTGSPMDLSNVHIELTSIHNEVIQTKVSLALDGCVSAGAQFSVKPFHGFNSSLKLAASVGVQLNLHGKVSSALVNEQQITYSSSSTSTSGNPAQTIAMKSGIEQVRKGTSASTVLGILAVVAACVVIAVVSFLKKKKSEEKRQDLAPASAETLGRNSFDQMTRTPADIAIL